METLHPPETLMTLGGGSSTMGLLKKLELSVIVFTLVISVFQINEVFSEGFNWKEEITNQAQQEGDSTVMNPVNNIAGAIITITRIICAGVAIIMLIVLAMKYMLSAPGDRAIRCLSANPGRQPTTSPSEVPCGLYSGRMQARAEQHQG